MNRLELKNKILKISNQLIADKGFICSIDILCELNYLNKSQIDDWRFGKIQYLEKVCSTNLGKLSFINKSIQEIAKDKELKPSWTAYNKYGKGKKVRLIFSKSQNETIEITYATHYLDSKRISEKRRNKKTSHRSQRHTQYVFIVFTQKRSISIVRLLHLAPFQLCNITLPKMPNLHCVPLAPLMQSWYSQAEPLT